MLTSATPIGARLSLPAKMTSSVLRARSVRLACSPRTQRRESATFVLPQPFGPTTHVTPVPNSSVVLLPKLLKPCTSRRFRYTLGDLLGVLDLVQRLLGGRFLGHLRAAALAGAERLAADDDLHREAARVVGA